MEKVATEDEPLEPTASDGAENDYYPTSLKIERIICHRMRQNELGDPNHAKTKQIDCRGWKWANLTFHQQRG